MAEDNHNVKFPEKFAHGNNDQLHDDVKSPLSSSSIENRDIEKGALHPIGSEANRALDYFDKHIKYTKEEERIVVRKIDFRMMRTYQILVCLYYLSDISKYLVSTPCNHLWPPIYR